MTLSTLSITDKNRRLAGYLVIFNVLNLLHIWNSDNLVFFQLLMLERGIFMHQVSLKGTYIKTVFLKNLGSG